MLADLPDASAIEKLAERNLLLLEMALDGSNVPAKRMSDFADAGALQF